MLQDKPIMNIQHVVLVEGGEREWDKHRHGNAAAHAVSVRPARFLFCCFFSTRYEYSTWFGSY